MIAATIVDSDSQFETSSSDRTYPTGIRMLSEHTSIKVSPPSVSGIVRAINGLTRAHNETMLNRLARVDPAFRIVANPEIE